MISREKLDKVNKRRKDCPDERQFNNFYISKDNLLHTPGLGNYSPRNTNIALEHFNGIVDHTQISTTIRKYPLSSVSSITPQTAALSDSVGKTQKKEDTSLTPDDQRTTLPPTYNLTRLPTASRRPPQEEPILDQPCTVTLENSCLANWTNVSSALTKIFTRTLMVN